MSRWEYASFSLDELKIHIRNKHNGVRYSCSQCKFAATTVCRLIKHIHGQFLIHVTIGTTIGRIYLSTLLW